MAAEMIFTSESVTAGHPDKLCDQISDAAIDAFLRQDPLARATIECALATGVVFLAAHFAAEASVDLPALARNVIADAGYLDGRFDARSCSILTSLSELPGTRDEAGTGEPDEARLRACVAHNHANAFGYACRETPELMPLPISLAHRLAKALDEARRHHLAWLSPDAKTQVAVVYCEGRPLHIHGLSLAVAPHSGAAPAGASEALADLARAAIAGCDISADRATRVSISIAPDHETGGPARHAGLTGRKSGIDAYGEIARQSGAALSGKDPSRIDRTGAYAVRQAAKTVVAAGLAERCEVHAAYAIGQAEPLSLAVQTFGTGRIEDEAIAKRLAATFDFRPAAIAHRFGLRRRPGAAGARGFYRPLAVYGHFGRTDLDLPWETVQPEALD